MNNTQLSEKIDQMVNMLLQISEHLQNSPMPQLVEQITTMTNFFKELPNMLQTSTETVTNEIITELRLMSVKLEKIQRNKNTCKGEVSTQYYKHFWK